MHNVHTDERSNCSEARQVMKSSTDLILDNCRQELETLQFDHSDGFECVVFTCNKQVYQIAITNRDSVELRDSEGRAMMRVQSVAHFQMMLRALTRFFH